MGADTLYAVMLILAFVPVLLVGLLWYWLFTSAPPRSRPRIGVLTALTMSQCWFFLGWAFPWTLGPYYSTVRFTFFGANIAVMAICFVVCWWTRGRGKLLIATSSLMYAVLWVLVAAVNSAV